MRYDKTIKVLDYYGKPVYGLRGPDDREPFSFGELFVTVCGLGMQGDRPDEKLKTYALGLRFLEPGNQVELTDLETVRLKALVGASFNPLILGRVHEFLDNPLPSTRQVPDQKVGKIDIYQVSQTPKVAP